MIKRVKLLILTMLTSLLLPSLAWAAETNSIDTGDTTFIILSAALVMIMTPGVALFYAGMVRKKNVLSTMMMSFIAISVVSIIWVLFGYSFAFGTAGHAGLNQFIGGLSYLGFNSVGPEALEGMTIPHFVFAAFQLMFAILTVAIISGSIAERMNFTAFIAFIALWATCIYAPLAHWVWGGGWLMQLGALDFAGGTVVHISSGISGLVAALVIGKRKGYGSEPLIPHNLPMTVLGAVILWFGWFGFNAGSALAANGLATSAFVVTHICAAVGGLSWVVAEWIHHGKPTLLGCISGAVAGLVVITPAAGFVTPLAALILGLTAGPLCYFAVAVVKAKLGYDDSLDAFGIHGVGGMWGAIATGLFCTTTVNELGANGLFYGNAAQLIPQLIGVIGTILFAAAGTFILLKIVGLFCNLRVTADDEVMGLDVSIHGENGYMLGDAFGGSLISPNKSTVVPK